MNWFKTSEKLPELDRLIVAKMPPVRSYEELLVISRAANKKYHPYVLTKYIFKYDWKNYKKLDVKIFEGFENDPPEYWAYITDMPGEEE